MSDTVGRIDLILDVDGKGLPGKVRRAGEKAGAEAGEGYNDKFGDEITKGAKERNKQIGEEGRKAGESYSDARDRVLSRRNKGLSDRLAKAFETPKGLQNYLNKFDDAGDGITSLRNELDELHDQNLISEEDFKRNKKILTDYRGVILRAADANKKLTAAQQQMDRDWDEAVKHNKAFDQALTTNQKNIQKWRKEIEGNLNRSLDQLAAKQRQVEKDSASWARALEKSRVESEKLSSTLDKTRIAVGNTFRDGDKGIDRYVQKFPTVREGVTKLKDELVRLREANVISGNEFEKSITHLTKYTRATKDLDSGLERVEKSFKKAGGGVNNFTNNVRQMPYILKTIAGYTALFTALAPAIAVLGSATGSGILALSTGVGALGLGLVTLIPAFKGMLGDVGKLPAKAQPAAQALQDMAGPLSDLQDTIQEGVFDGLGPQINKLTKSIFPRLEKGFGKTAKTINGLFQDLIRGLTSKDSLGRIDDIFSGLQPILKSLGQATLSLGSALAKLFQAAIPSGQKFADFVNTTLSDFNNWLSSDSGRKALTVFFDHLNEIMPSVGGLVAAAGKAVAGLVTNQAVDNMTKFLDTMSGAIPGIVGGFGELVDALDPLGLASQALKGLGDFMTVHKGDFTTLGNGIHDFIQSGANLVGPIIKGVADQVLRIGPGVFKNLSDGLSAINTPELQSAVKTTLPKLGDALLAASKAVSSLLKAVGKSGVISSAITTIGSAAGVAAPLLTALSIALDTLSGDFDSAGKSMKGLDFKQIIPDFVHLAGAMNPLVGIINFIATKLFHVDLGAAFKSLGDQANKFFDNLGTIFPIAAKVLVANAKTMIKTLPNLFFGLVKALFGFGGGGKSGGGDGNSEAKKAGEKAVTGAGDAAKAKVLALPSLGAALIAKLFSGIGDFDFGSLLTKPFQGIPDKIGGFLSGVPGVIGGIFGGLGSEGQKGADNVKKPFSFVPPGISGLLGNIPGIVGGIMGLVSGKKGADNTKNPFSSVLGGIMNFLNPVPGSVSGKVAQSSGKAGAKNTSDPFLAVLAAINRAIGGVPGSVTSKVSQASGQKGANNTSEPFSKVAGKIGGYVGGVAGIVKTSLANVSGAAAADRIVQAFANVKSRVSSALSGLSGIVNGALGVAKAALSAGIGALRVPKTAVGGTFDGAQMRIIGEAGPEAVVPLNRPLSQVDPSVRALSAIAQGKFPAASASGGAGRIVNVAEGAIMVAAPNSDAEQVASAMLDRLITKL